MPSFAANFPITNFAKIGNYLVIVSSSNSVALVYN
jgi:hypothetical protein